MATFTFVRHAQALHNVDKSKLRTRDNPLTQAGIDQCLKARAGEAGCLVAEAELVVVSPLRRALHTAQLLSGRNLEMEDGRFLVTPLCSEMVSSPCDLGSPPRELIADFPFQGVLDLADEWWPALPESTVSQEKRVLEFLGFLLDRPESKVVVVAHGDFLEWITGTFMSNLATHTVSADELRAVQKRLTVKAKKKREMMTKLKKSKRATQSGVPPYLDMPFFTLEDGEAWTEHLHDHGVVVLKGLIPKDDVEKAKSLYWDWLESLGSGIQRENPKTWISKNWPGVPGLGFTTTDGGGHTEASWFLRAHSRVRMAFERIWGTTRLLTSFDTFITWRPFTIARPRVENLHIDQNPFSKRGLHGVQGMIPLFPVNQEIGGLQVIPKSHKDGCESSQERIRELYPHHQFHTSDWIEFEQKHYHMFPQAQLVKADPGDMILWDSRLVHGGYVGTGPASHESELDLMRLSFTVCQTPYTSMEEGREHEIIRSRIQAFHEQACTSHWPHAPVNHNMGNDRFHDRQRIQIDMTDTIRDLIGNAELLDETEV